MRDVKWMVSILLLMLMVMMSKVYIVHVKLAWRLGVSGGCLHEIAIVYI